MGLWPSLRGNGVKDRSRTRRPALGGTSVRRSGLPLRLLPPTIPCPPQNSDDDTGHADRDGNNDLGGLGNMRSPAGMRVIVGGERHRKDGADEGHRRNNAA